MCFLCLFYAPLMVYHRYQLRHVKTICTDELTFSNCSLRRQTRHIVPPKPTPTMSRLRCHAPTCSAPIPDSSCRRLLRYRTIPDPGLTYRHHLVRPCPTASSRHRPLLHQTSSTFIPPTHSYPRPALSYRLRTLPPRSSLVIPPPAKVPNPAWSYRRPLRSQIQLGRTAFARINNKPASS